MRKNFMVHFVDIFIGHKMLSTCVFSIKTINFLDKRVDYKIHSSQDGAPIKRALVFFSLESCLAS